MPLCGKHSSERPKHLRSRWNLDAWGGGVPKELRPGAGEVALPSGRCLIDIWEVWEAAGAAGKAGASRRSKSPLLLRRHGLAPVSAGGEAQWEELARHRRVCRAPGQRPSARRDGAAAGTQTFTPKPRAVGVSLPSARGDPGVLGRGCRSDAGGAPELGSSGSLAGPRPPRRRGRAGPASAGGRGVCGGAKRASSSPGPAPWSPGAPCGSPQAGPALPSRRLRSCAPRWPSWPRDAGDAGRCAPGTPGTRAGGLRGRRDAGRCAPSREARCAASARAPATLAGHSARRRGATYSGASSPSRPLRPPA